jgi:hypothetical protein
MPYIINLKYYIIHFKPYTINLKTKTPKVGILAIIVFHKNSTIGEN